jgi:hypothetical protein
MKGTDRTSSTVSVPSQDRFVRQNVFLNVPFDFRYSPLFTTVVGGLAALGREPHCVLEVPSDGQNRLERIYGLIASCGASIHDLSRISLSGTLRVPRFNMPFELGIAYALSRQQTHQFFVFEAREHRLQASLSDMNGHDPQIHGETQSGILRCILNCFGTPEGAPSFSVLMSLTRRLNHMVAGLQQEQGLSSPFHSYLFRRTVIAAVKLARAEGLIA